MPGSRNSGAVVNGTIEMSKSQVPARPAESKPAAGGLASLEGCLERYPFPALLHHLHGLRATGVLHLSHEKKRKWLEFREGYPVAVRGNLVTECLGNLLVRQGRVSPAREKESRRYMKKRGQLQGEVLVAMEALTPKDMAMALRAQAEQKLYEIFAWPGGNFRFELGAQLQRANALPVEMSPANIIFTGVRKRLATNQVDELLRRSRDARIAPAESPFYRFQDIHLDPEQEAVLRRLDGTQCVAGFLGAEESTRRTLYGLIATGLVELRPGEDPTGRAAAKGRPP